MCFDAGNTSNYSFYDNNFCWLRSVTICDFIILVIIIMVAIKADAVFILLQRSSQHFT